MNDVYTKSWCCSRLRPLKMNEHQILVDDREDDNLKELEEMDWEAEMKKVKTVFIVTQEKLEQIIKETHNEQ